MTKDIIYILIGQAAFILSGYMLNIFMGRSLGPELYGIFGIVSSLHLIFERFFGGAVSKGLTKAVAENERAARSIINYSIKIQLLFSASAFAVFYAGADYIASLMGDVKLTEYLRILALLIIISGFYITYNAVLNGLRAFGKQTAVSIVYAGARVIFVVLPVLLGFSLKGAIWGLALSGIACLLLSWHYCRPYKGREAFDRTALINYSWKVLGFTLATQLIMNIDLLSVKIILKNDLATGFYTAVLNLARVPALAVLPVSIVIFPVIVKSVSDNDRARAAEYVNRVFRYMALFLLPFAVMTSATSQNLITLFYGDIYSGGAHALSILVFGLTFIAITITMNTVILAVCDLTKVILFNIFLVVFDILLNIFLIKQFGIAGASAATTLTGIAGCMFSTLYVFKYFPFTVKGRSFVNILLSSLIIGIIARSYPFDGVLLLLSYLMLYGIYFAVLFLLREINSQDFNTLKSVNFMKGTVHKKTA